LIIEDTSKFIGKTKKIEKSLTGMIKVKKRRERKDKTTYYQLSI